MLETVQIIALIILKCHLLICFCDLPFPHILQDFFFFSSVREQDSSLSALKVTKIFKIVQRLYHKKNAGGFSIAD